MAVSIESRRTKLLCCLAATTIALCACDRPTATTMPTAVTTSVRVVIQPGPVLPQSIVPVGCPGSPVIPATFVIVVQPSNGDFRMDAVAIHFIDGSSRTGSPITFPSSTLNQEFGSTVIAAGSTRAFSFTPTIACLPFVPTFLQADVFGTMAGTQSFHTQVSTPLH